MRTQYSLFPLSSKLLGLSGSNDLKVNEAPYSKFESSQLTNWQENSKSQFFIMHASPHKNPPFTDIKDQNFHAYPKLASDFLNFHH